MEQIIGLLVFAGIIAVGFYYAKSRHVDRPGKPGSGGNVVNPPDGPGGNKE